MAAVQPWCTARFPLNQAMWSSPAGAPGMLPAHPKLPQNQMPQLSPEGDKNQTYCSPVVSPTWGRSLGMKNSLGCSWSYHVVIRDNGGNGLPPGASPSMGSAYAGTTAETTTPTATPIARNTLQHLYIPPHDQSSTPKEWYANYSADRGPHYDHLQSYRLNSNASRGSFALAHENAR